MAYRRILAGLLLTVLVIIGAALIGPSPVTLCDIRGGTATEGGLVFWQLRLPRVLLALLAGAALSLSGMSFQSLFRNPLATPYTLGVSGGAALGATLYYFLNLHRLLGSGWGGQTAAAFLGALLTILLIYGITRLSRGFSTATLLLAGIAVSFFFGSVILMLQYLSSAAEAYRIIRWMMGAIQPAGWREVWTPLPFLLAGCGILLMHIRAMDLMLLGDDLAIARGLNLKRARQWIFIGASMSVAAVVAACGPIGFVGMIIPHICRLITGAGHRHLAPLSLFAGGWFLILCDTLARTLLAPSEIPVGIITALMGGPFFIFVLIRKDK